MAYQPPFEITDQIVHRISSISQKIGRLEGQNLRSSPQLRKQNRIRTIQGTLAIEGNSLSLKQITAILDGQWGLGQPREILEVQGAIRAYEALPTWNPASLKDFLQAHADLMGDILVDAGKLRKGNVGIHKREEVVHIAPPAQRVPLLMEDLMGWLERTNAHALVKSCVFHYELEFIHPFMDGNGRMGRLWQTLILGQWNELFYLLPIESLIKDEQKHYYQVLAEADQAASSTVFVEFMLQIVETALMASDAAIVVDTDQADDQVSDQADIQANEPVQQLLSGMGESWWTAKELMEMLGLSHRPTFRKNYLNPALTAGLVVMCYPDKPRSPKQRYRKA